MSVPFNPTRNATAGSTAAPTTSNLTTTGQCAINAYTGTYYMRKEDATISDIVGDRLSGFRNRLINGNMAIDQRNAGASVSTASGISVYSVDRWACDYSQTSKISLQQNAGAITPPSGFLKYLGVVSLSAYSVTSTDYFVLNQRIEGLNVADLGWGTSNAAAVTVSFRVYSSLTGTFGGAIRNSSSNRSYPFTYTVSSANTWTTISITIPGDTSGTWSTDNSIGMFVYFGIGVGSSNSGTAGAWATANYISATGAVSVVGTNAATFYITGVQLEKGLVPTPFEVRSYGTELALCQRYCVVYNNTISGQVRVNAINYGTTNVVPTFTFPVTLRSTPSGIIASAGSTFVVITNGITLTPSAVTFDSSSTYTASLGVAVVGAVAGYSSIFQLISGGRIEFTGTEL